MAVQYSPTYLGVSCSPPYSELGPAAPAVYCTAYGLKVIEFSTGKEGSGFLYYRRVLQLMIDAAAGTLLKVRAAKLVRSCEVTSMCTRVISLGCSADFGTLDIAGGSASSASKHTGAL